MIVNLDEIVRNDDSFVVVDAFEFLNSKIIKLTSGCYKMTEKCSNNGIKMFMLSIPPDDIVEDEYIEGKTCSKFELLNSHYSYEILMLKTCPKFEHLKSHYSSEILI